MLRKLAPLRTALGERDAETRLHSDRVGRLCHEIGRHIGLSAAELETLDLGACLHDIGKIGIPDQLLHKPGDFAAEERERMRAHTMIGERIVLAVDDDRTATLASVVRHHHENFDGSGYPDALSGTAIPLPARILSLADSYDAMANRRPYRSSQLHRDIIATLSGPDAAKFDPDLLHAFRHVIEHSPLRAA